jgi:hypothetical protein
VGIEIEKKQKIKWKGKGAASVWAEIFPFWSTKLTRASRPIPPQLLGPPVRALAPWRPLSGGTYIPAAQPHTHALWRACGSHLAVSSVLCHVGHTYQRHLPVDLACHEHLSVELHAIPKAPAILASLMHVWILQLGYKIQPPHPPWSSTSVVACLSPELVWETKTPPPQTSSLACALVDPSGNALGGSPGSMDDEHGLTKARHQARDDQFLTGAAMAAADRALPWVGAPRCLYHGKPSTLLFTLLPALRSIC